MRAWLTPDEDPAGSVHCWRVFCPVGEGFEAALRGALAMLAIPGNWEQYGSVTPDRAAQAWVDANYKTYRMEHCMIVGSVFAYAGTSTPDNTMDCDGRQLNRDDYPALFATIGTIYGAPTGDTFSLPSLGGRFVSGVGGGAGYSLGDNGGSDTVALALGNLPAHDHAVPAHAHGVHGHGVSLAQLGVGSAVSTPSMVGGETGLWAGDTGSTGGGEAHENRPPYVALRWLIVVR